ncbi:MAG: tetratricopeptide repeat protein [Candidatus Krumholzibacteriota bacterium]|nr:tetratricopeptide repeat protein [Candidatus Krumholzibacteriota bacterium]
MPADLTGQTISRFQILERLGEGGMGVVYRARDTRLGRQVALKFLHAGALADAAVAERFEREARAAAALDHPGICTVHDLVEAGGHHFLVMCLLEGETLEARLARGPLTADEAAALGRRLARALAAAHAAGVVHRDLKPGNVMLSGGEAVVMDFGLARILDDAPLTRPGVPAGTAAYMAPEQARGETAAPASDLWALGVILYEALAGRRPFTAPNLPALLRAICEEDPPPLASLRAGLPPALTGLVARCLSRDPDARPTTAEAEHILADLEAGDLARTVASHPPVGGARRGPGRVLRVALVAATLGAAVLLMDPGLRCGPAPLAPGGEKHVAVLGLANLSPVEGDRCLCDGLVEFLSNRLAQLETSGGALRVIPRAVLAGQGVTDPRGAARLGANLVVTGSFQREGERVRLTLDLLCPARGRIRRPGVVEAAGAGAFDLQDRALAELVRMLELELGDSRGWMAGGAGVHGGRAVEACLRGRGRLQGLEDLSPAAALACVDSARVLFERAAADAPDWAPAHASLGEACWRRYELTGEAAWAERARAAVERALDLEERDTEILRAAGLVHAGTGRTLEAVDDFRRALALDSLDATARRHLARCYGVLGDDARAEAAYRQALSLRPDDWIAHEDLGRHFYRRGRFDEAAASFREVIRLTPENPRGWSNLGGMYLLQGRVTESREAFERSLALAPTFAAWSNLGVLHDREGRYGEAAGCYHEALALRGHDYRLWGNLASAQLKLGDEPAARASYGRAVERGEEALGVNPGDAGLMVLLAGYRRTLGETEAAALLLRRATALAPEDVEVLYQAGHTYEQMGRRELALEMIGRALERGYPLAAVERSVWLRDLRADPRYGALAARAAAVSGGERSATEGGTP